MRSRLLLLPVLFLATAALAPARQDPPAGQAGRPIVRTDFDLLIERMFEKHGGIDRVEELDALRFNLIPVQVSKNEAGSMPHFPNDGPP